MKIDPIFLEILYPWRPKDPPSKQAPLHLVTEKQAKDLRDLLNPSELPAPHTSLCVPSLCYCGGKEL